MSRCYKAIRCGDWKPRWSAWRRDHDAKHAMRAHNGGHVNLERVAIQPPDGVQEADTSTNGREEDKDEDEDVDVEEDQNDTTAQ